MATYEVLEPGGHARLVSDTKGYANRASGVGTTQIADESVTSAKLADDVTDTLDNVESFTDPMNKNGLHGTIAEGAVLTADDAYPMPPRDVDVFGKSTQAGTPTPDAPVSIKSVDDLTLVLTGKNLFGGTALHDVLMGISGAAGGTDQYGNAVAVGAAGLNNVVLFDVPFKPSTQYTLILRLAKHSGNTNANIRVNYTNNTYEYVFLPNNFTADVPYVVTLTTASGKTVKEVVGINASVGTIFYYDQCGIFEGILTADQYEPYVGTSVSIPLSDHSIRSLPDGTRDELELTYLRPSTRAGWGVYSKTLTQRVAYYEVPTNDGGWSVSGEHFIHARGNIPSYQGWAVWKLCNANVPNKVAVTNVVQIMHGGVTLESFLAAMDGNPVTLQMALATPITHDLGTVELPILPNPLTAWADGGSAQPTMSMTYERDVNIVISNMMSVIADAATS